MQNVVINMCEKIHYDQLRNDRALGMENLITTRRTFVELEKLAPCLHSSRDGSGIRTTWRPEMNNRRSRVTTATRCCYYCYYVRRTLDV